MFLASLIEMSYFYWTIVLTFKSCRNMVPSFRVRMRILLLHFNLLIQLTLGFDSTLQINPISQ